ncbi:MAG: cytochrome b/b6 domain-containing protein [Alphaproteobacteria bacterium]|nr:cytochrome b/b6 domain-containing protein [Alphaproteobacteria bacterium]MBV8407211.1 cytochrome b/b6 domain-containing protein [Alphaproteobacteria bacterium]
MAQKTDRLRIWDLPVRLFHWCLVLLLCVSYFTGEAGGDWRNVHLLSGYTILTLLLFRIAWGFVGSTTARFSDFVKGPRACIHYLACLVRGRSTFEAGHNPAGGLMVIVLLLAVLTQVTAGLFSVDTDTAMVNGPLSGLLPDKWSERITKFHWFWVNVLLVLVAVHVLAAITYLVWKRQNLIGAMFTGYKPRADVVAPGGREPALRFAPAKLALSLLIAAAAIVYFIVRVGG